MAKRCIAGIDVGTSGCKTIIIDEDGKVLASVNSKEYPLYTPYPMWSEQDPADWWEAALESIANAIAKSGVAKEDIKGIGMSGQMHGLVALDENDRVIRHAILWNDQRTQKSCDEITALAGGPEGLLGYTNNSMLTGYTGGKIFWLRDNEPETYARMKCFLNPKDYIGFMLTGVKRTEVSDASGTGFFDVRHRRWSTGMIEKVGLNPDFFPQVLESYGIVGKVKKDIAEKIGVGRDCLVIAGGGDSVVQTLSTGVVKPGRLGCTYGTAGVVATGVEGYMDNPEGKLQLFCGPGDNAWWCCGAILAAGGSYQWLRNVLCEYEIEKARAEEVDPYDIINDRAARSPAGSRGILFMPYLAGERCPYPDPKACGGFIGLTQIHNKDDICRAVIEGVTLAMRHVKETMGDIAKNVTEIIMTGGVTRSQLWKQIQADVFQLPVKTISNAVHGGAYGAAMIAGVGSNVFADMNAAIGVLKVDSETLPNPKNKDIYDAAYNVYVTLYGALKPAFDAIAEYR